MGWGSRTAAIFVGLVALAFGAWFVTLLSLLYLFLSLRKPTQRRPPTRQDILQRPRRPWGTLALGGSLLLLSGVALREGGVSSPAVLFLAGAGVIAWQFVRGSGLARQVVPMDNSILLRGKWLPFRWHALAEVKLEAQDQTRGLSSMDGELLVFAGKNPSVFKVVSAYAFGHQGAEDKVIRVLGRQTRMLSQRGAHLLPLDSIDAYGRLSLKLRRLRVVTEDFEAVTSLPFDVFTLQARGGIIVRHRAFMIEAQGTASIPPADANLERHPLFAEVVEEISERHGWPPPDEASPFLAALDASRAEPIGDRLKTKGESCGKLTVETPGGAEVKLTRAQLRALARIYA